jgi:K+:H+ antiporter
MLWLTAPLWSLMAEVDFPLDILVVLAAALVGGIVAQSLRLPAIVGYIAAGIAFGPETPGVDLDAEQMQDVAELGVVFLMFALGVEFSFDEVATLGRAVPFAVLGQVVATVLLGLVLVPLFGLSVAEALFMGGVISISSTFVALKLLDDLGEMTSTAGRLVVVFLIVQDLSVVALINVLPELESATDEIAGDLLVAIAVAVAFLAVVFVVGVRLIPPLFERIALQPTRELFLLAVLSLGLGMALAAEEAGLSLAFGAFLAGLVVSESRYGLQALAQTLPFRDIFATVFFVAIGMLIDPDVFLDEPLKIVALTTLIVLGKGVIVYAFCRLLRFTGEISLRAGLALAQIGEFSFVLALVGVEEGLISASLNEVVLASVLVSILISTVGSRHNKRLVAALNQTAFAGLVIGAQVPSESGVLPGGRHVVVCGYGRTGRELVRVLRRREFAFNVVENDPALRRRLEEEGVPWIYGDASSPVVLERCNLEQARLLAITFADRAAKELTVSNALRINPRLEIIVRGRGADDHARLVALGASEVVHPELEGGLEFVRHTLRRFGLNAQEIQAIVSRRRNEFFGR